MMPVKVYLVDDHRLFLVGVRAELSEEFSIVGSAYDVDTAIEEIRGLNPDVVLVDVHMPDGGGIAVVEGVAQTNPDVKFLALSVSDQAEDVIAMIRAGARGYVTKTIEPADLSDAVRRINAGDAVFSPRLAGFVLDAFAGAMPSDEDPELDQLTSREKDVLRLIARGFAYKQVARKLNISIKTVETHVSSVLRKLQLTNRHELARWASKRRIV
jgi:DNA-binding NarL/FixJ family response regulator